MAVRLHITHIPEIDRLIALEYGRVDEGQPAESWRPVGEPADDAGPFLGYLHERPRGRVVGFKVVEYSQLDVDAPDLREIWGRPRFDVPILGLSDVSAGETILAARAVLGGRATIGHELFTRAAAETGPEGLGLWFASLEAGEAAAHYGVGNALYDAGRYRAAYRHLRYYTEIAPALSWTWWAYGRAAEALALDGEARAGYRRAVELEELEGCETGARKLLADLDARTPRRRSPRWRRRRA